MLRRQACDMHKFEILMPRLLACREINRSTARLQTDWGLGGQQVRAAVRKVAESPSLSFFLESTIHGIYMELK
jgi:hypothetical protein